MDTPDTVDADTNEMPSLDLDLDMNSMTEILDESAKALSESLDEDAVGNAGSRARKRQA